MSLHFDYAEISRQARKIVDANRARTIAEQAAAQRSAGPLPDDDQPRKRLKYTRSTTGCIACRKHKVKCDETTPTCLRCVAAQRPCEYPQPGEFKNSKRRKRETSGTSVENPGSSQSAREGEVSWGVDNVSPLDQLASSDVAKLEPSLGDGNAADFEFLSGFTPFSSALPAADPSLLVTPPDVGSSSSSAASALLQTMPHFTNLAKSLLINRRAGKRPDPHSTPTPPIMIPPRLLMVDSILQYMNPADTPAASLISLRAYATDDSLFEFGPSRRNLGQPGSTDVLSNAFPSPVARTLFHHYCNNTSRILITMGNIGPNPLLALCTPLNLLDTHSAASAAIRMSMLSTSVTHFAHEAAQSLAAEPGFSHSHWAVQWGKMKELGRKFKKAALANTLLAASGDGSPHQTDSILAACTLLCIRDVISADPTWRENLEFALNVVTKKGGPQEMLKGAQYSFTRRYLLENLATHDVFSSFITGKEPTLLGNFDPWWFESVETSQTRWEWESVERTFGISRAMVDLVARVAVLDSQKRRLALSLKGPPDEMWDIGQHFVREGQCLLLELDIWGNSLNGLPQHVRVTCGDYIYKYMAVIFILADILEQPTTTPRIVKAINHVLELCSEASAMRQPVMLIWPLLIAGVFCQVEVRTKVRELFDAFRFDYCEDLEVARDLLEEQWKGIDAGQGKKHWCDVMAKLGKSVLLI